jgi:hypothetical protein
LSRSSFPASRPSAAIACRRSRPARPAFDPFTSNPAESLRRSSALGAQVPEWFVLL